MEHKNVNTKHLIKTLKDLGRKWHILISGICVIGLHQVKFQVEPLINDLKSEYSSFDDFLKDFYGNDYTNMINMPDNFRSIIRELWEK